MKKMWTTDWYMLVGVGVCLGTRSTFINPDQFRDSKIQFVWKTEHAAASHPSLLSQVAELDGVGGLLLCWSKFHSSKREILEMEFPNYEYNF